MIGKTISHYKILEKLGEGGMGVVYKARDTKLDRFVALKFLPPHSGKSKEEKERFFHEARAASRLQHNNICAIHEIGETEDGQLFICMDFYEGATLDQRIKQGPLPLKEAVDIAVQIAQGLNEAHDKYIIHRDVKPTNVLITDTHIIKILDFGLAKLKGGTVITKESTTLGTVSYMSPEQSQGKKVDQRSDIWSLGVVLYELITGNRPFSGDYDQAVVYSIMNEAPEPLTGVRTGVPLELERIVSKTLSKKTEERYQHVSELVVDLKKVREELKGEKTSSKTITDRPVRKPFWKRLASVIAGILALIAVTIGIVWFISQRESVYRDMWIAVLPFDPITKTTEDSIFCDGFHDALLTQLQKIGDLHIISRTTMISYKNSGKRPPEIAREQRVKWVIEGTYQRQGDRILTSVQLIEGRTDDHKWANDYNMEYTPAKIIDIQRQMAQNVARECKASLTTEEQTALAYIPTQNTEAYEYYQKGKWYWDNKPTTKGNEQAAQFLEKAISLDSTFALAWAYLSIVDVVLYSQFDQSEQVKMRAKEAFVRAKVLNPDLPEVHYAESYFLEYIEKDFDAALEACNKAIAGSPNNSEYYVVQGFCLETLGKFNEAVESHLKSYELDPNSSWAPMALVINYNLQKKWSESEKWAKLLISQHPENPLGYNSRAVIYLNGYGQIEKARHILQEGSQLVDDPNSLIGFQYGVELYARNYDAVLEINERNRESSGYSYRKALMLDLMGKEVEARVMWDSLRVAYEQRVKTDSVNPDIHQNLGISYAYLGRKQEAIVEGLKAVDLNPAPSNKFYYMSNLIYIYIMTDEYDTAIERIKEALEEPGIWITPWTLRLDPRFDPLRDDPRFQALVE
ncbi:protein kinase [bacterium]|nr:protein kinase [bacterium]